MRHPLIPTQAGQGDDVAVTSFLKALVDLKAVGLFSYLSGRDHNRTRIELEKARQAATADLLDHLPCGAIFRESTADGWREVWMPPLPTLLPPALPAGGWTPPLDENQAIPTRIPKEIEHNDTAKIAPPGDALPRPPCLLHRVASTVLPLPRGTFQANVS